jgi:hypothetical protein
MVTRLKRQLTEWEKIFASSWQGINNKNIKGAQKTSIPKSMTQGGNEQMNWAELFQRMKSKRPSTHEEMLNIPGHNGKANQNHVKIPPYSC